MANLVQSLTDSTGLTDAGQSLGHEGAAGDDRGAVDTATPTLTTGTNWTQSLTDSTGLTDAGSQYGLEGETTDARGAVDTATPTLTSGTNWTQSLTDSTGLTDTGQSLGHEGAAGDDRGAVDTATPTLTTGTSHTRSVTDGRGSTDAGQSLGHDGATSDASGLTDAATPNLTIASSTSYVRTPLESQGLTDQALTELTKGVEDNTGLVESPDFGSVRVSETVDDSGGRSDSSLVFRPAPASDDTGLSDLIALAQARGVAELLARVDSVTVVVGFARLLNDGGGRSDTVSGSFTPGAGTDGTVTLNDTATSRTDDTTVDQAFSVAEGRGITDTPAFLLTGTAQAFTAAPFDALTLADSVVLDFSIEKSDTLGSADVLDATGLVLVVDLENALGLADVVTAPRPGGKVRGGRPIAPRVTGGQRPRAAASASPVRPRTGSGVPVRSATIGGST